YRVGFEPLKNQPDGSVWITEQACKDPSKLPAGYNVYRANMLDSASYCYSDPAKAGLEPAMVKILLGVMYIDRGREVISLPCFDLMRACITGAIPAPFSFNWLRSTAELRARWPFEVVEKAHTIWGGCPDGMTFRGGVSLFGHAIVEVKIDGF